MDLRGEGVRGGALDTGVRGGPETGPLWDSISTHVKLNFCF